MMISDSTNNDMCRVQSNVVQGERCGDVKAARRQGDGKEKHWPRNAIIYSQGKVMCLHRRKAVRQDMLAVGRLSHGLHNRCTRHTYVASTGSLPTRLLRSLLRTSWVWRLSGLSCWRRPSITAAWSTALIRGCELRCELEIEACHKPGS